jgi:transcriptional regulator with XRE-family HTH domain
MDGTTGSAGDKIRGVRKRRGLSQKELAKASGFSLSWVKKLEQGESDAPVETLRRIAIALKVPTIALIAGAPVIEGADQRTAEDWTEVRDALYEHAPPPEGDVTCEGVLGVVTSLRPALAANRFAEARTVLPGLLRDAWALDGEGRYAQSRVFNLAAWLLTQTRQWDAAADAARMSADAAPDRLEAAAALNTLCWLRLRRGELAEARGLATAGANSIEPRFSAATPKELMMWGRLLLGITNAAIRDNRPGEAADALSLARAAAGRIGREVCLDGATARTFGPVSVMMIMAENAAIDQRPDQVLAIAANIPAVAATLPGGVLHPAAASRRRHRLDVANALVMLRRYPEAMGIMAELRAEAPEWLVQQRYARQVLKNLVDKRRTLTREMRDLADAVGLPL